MLALTFLSTLIIHQALASPTVEIQNGTLVGKHMPQFGLDYFLGIPYAEAPLGKLRYANPVPVETPWEEPRPASEYGNACIGYPGDIDTSIASVPMDEDCLSLNIVRPASNSTYNSNELLPVLIWIHGGGYYTGASSEPRYNLTNLTSLSVSQGTPMITVSINYRLSMLGFLASENIVEDGEANLGMKDQRLALKWVQENIGAFGGDKERVTVWGESAGGFSVGLHMHGWNADTEGLFRAAICQSGGPYTDGTYRSLDYYTPHYNAFIEAAGCSNTTTNTSAIDCLRSLPISALNETVIALDQSQVWSMPVIDGVVMKTLASETLEQGRFAKVPLLTGTTSDESAPYVLGLGIETEEQFDSFISTPDNVNVTLSNTTIAKLAAAYPLNGPEELPANYSLPSNITSPLYSHYKRVNTYHSDRTQIAPRRWTAQAWSAFDVPVYSYRFDARWLAYPEYLGVFHFSDVPFVMGNVDGAGFPEGLGPFEGAPESYYEMSREMGREWVRFTVEGTVGWEAYGEGRQRVWSAEGSYMEEDNYREEGMSALKEARGDLGI